MMKTIVPLLVMTVLLSACSGALPSPTPQPTLTHAELAAMKIETSGAVNNVHDPTLIKAGDTYYLFSTGAAVPFRCSPDMKTWEICGRVFSLLPPTWARELVPKVGDLWAPDIVFHNGKYYLYYSASSFGVNTSAIGLVTNTTLDPNNPNYSWEDEGLVIASKRTDRYNTIDPNLTFDKDGQPWLVFGSFWGGLKMVKIDPATFKPVEGAELTSLAYRAGSNAIEGGFITQRGNYYYLFASFDFCCRGVESTYNIRVGRSTEITGPYVDRDGKPMMDGGGTLVYGGSKRWIGPGHNSIFIENDTYYMVYHAYDAQQGGTPVLHIEALLWDADDWPLSPSALLGE
jgi:arabinan endo-1,5-alpha-L-arabinosidase